MDYSDSYSIMIKVVSELQQHIAKEWDKLDQRVIDKAVEQWQKRPSMCGEGGGQFEHKKFTISDVLYLNFQAHLPNVGLF